MAAILSMPIGGSSSLPAANLNCHRLRVLRPRRGRKTRNRGHETSL
ncbi:MAG TPA: hypothetical protein V6C78_08070 [Crinalium sp.]